MSYRQDLPIQYPTIAAVPGDRRHDLIWKSGKITKQPKQPEFTACHLSHELPPTLHHVFFEKCQDRDVWIVEVRSQARAGQNRDDALSHGRSENTIVEMNPSSRNDSSHNAQPQCYQKATTPNLCKLHETS